MSNFKITIWTLGTMLAVGLLICIQILIHPLARPSVFIEKAVLKEIPLGTSMDDALEIIEENPEWKLDYVSKRYGYGINKHGCVSYDESEYVCAKYIRMDVGYYNVLIDCYVEAFLGFDENEKLTIVTIQKDYG